MDPFRLSLILGPLAIYLLLVGSINLSRRSFVVSGARDMAALGLAASGLMIVGPIQLFFPEAAAIRFGAGAAVWLMLAILYLLALFTALLWVRPRLVIYNITPDQLRPILAELVPTLDGEARWAGDSLALPGLSVQLTIDAFTAMRNVSLVSAGSAQSAAGWGRLETALRDAMRRREIGRNLGGLTLVGTAVAMLLAVVWFIARDPGGVSQALFDMLR